jgi:hypothetical protein
MNFGQVCEVPKAGWQNSRKFCCFEIPNFGGQFPKASGAGPKTLEYERSRVWSFVACEVLVAEGPSM